MYGSALWINDCCSTDLLDHGALEITHHCSLVEYVLKSGNGAYLQYLLDKGLSLRVDHRGDDLIYAAEGGIDMINFLSKRGILMVASFIIVMTGGPVHVGLKKGKWQPFKPSLNVQ